MAQKQCNSIEELSAEFSKYVITLDQFEIGKKIGQGGFSKVYVGLNKKTGQLCALKILNYKNLHHDRMMLFDREIRILALANNRFVLDFIGFTTTVPYAIVTEYIPNGCLYDILHSHKSEKVLTGTEKTIIAIGIACGVQTLNKLGIIHRDLKSLNILLDSNYGPKICDFGLSRFHQENKNDYMTTNVGTVHWMAPELFVSSSYDYKVDVYAYGILLWELLTGHMPFHDMKPMQVAYAVCKENKRPKIPSKTPPSLRDLITSCWDQNPSKRPSFKKILKTFKHHKAKFPDTNDDVITQLFHDIKSKTIPTFKKYQHLPVQFQNKNNVSNEQSKQPQTQIPKQQPNTNTNMTKVQKVVMPRDVNSPTFGSDLEKIAITKMLSIKDSSAIMNMIVVSETLARVQYNSEFLELLPALQVMIESDGWRSFAISLICTLSMYKETREHLKKFDFVRKIQMYKDDPQLLPYVQCFLRNMADVY
ncbi:TKL family protein kinase [Histomonas meleagridis]|uniref:TKL family protein kinase n=1 Tax=Histomonas meleagridis TaxID=135588 RepID=UPI0035598014|nr:TKL family protein kinase [Histomonas meleagridis]KAH0799904.1 TKL family protein kinase [Histomonas meleagridis]